MGKGRRIIRDVFLKIYVMDLINAFQFCLPLGTMSYIWGTFERQYALWILGPNQHGCLRTKHGPKCKANTHQWTQTHLHLQELVEGAGTLSHCYTLSLGVRTRRSAPAYTHELSTQPMWVEEVPWALAKNGLKIPKDLHGFSQQIAQVLQCEDGWACQGSFSFSQGETIY